MSVAVTRAGRDLFRCQGRCRRSPCPALPSCCAGSSGKSPAAASSRGARPRCAPSRRSRSRRKCLCRTPARPDRHAAGAGRAAAGLDGLRSRPASAGHGFAVGDFRSPARRPASSAPLLSSCAALAPAGGSLRVRCARVRALAERRDARQRIALQINEAATAGADHQHEHEDMPSARRRQRPRPSYATSCSGGTSLFGASAHAEPCEQVDDVDLALAATPQQRAIERLHLLARQAGDVARPPAVRARQHCGPAAERMLAGEQLVRDAREAVNVVARVRLAAVHALDARISGRAGRRGIERRGGVQIERTVPRETEIEHAHFAVDVIMMLRGLRSA